MHVITKSCVLLLWMHTLIFVKSQAQRCPSILVPINVMVLGNAEEATYGNMVRFRCKLRNQILNGPRAVFCNENGEWSEAVNSISCDDVKCKKPEIENGVIERNVMEYDENEILHYRCNQRYKKTQGIDSRCTNSGGRAEWIPTPACEAIKCELPLPPIRGTTYEPAYRNRFSPGEKVTVTCGDRYWISDSRGLSAEVTCKEDGDWTLRPVCQEVTCSRPRDRYFSYWEDSWYGQQKKLGETARYRCKSDYRSTDGATWATCTRAGWEPNPLCRELKCQMKHYNNADITGFIKSEYRFNEPVQYKCKSDNKKTFTLVCGENGWIGNNECTVLPCGRPPSLEDGDIKNTTKERYNHSETIEYMCQSYYTMEGAPYRTCYDGEWTGHMRCLNPCIVNEDEMRQHNITFKSSDHNKYLVHDEMVEFKCARGLPVGKVAMSQRCNSEVVVLPTCREDVN